MDTSGDLDQDPYAGLPQHDVTAAMTLAEAYPNVPLRIVFAELRHADTAVPIGADDRAEIISWLVAARLGYLAADQNLRASPTQ
jgi:hypothetical protein